MLCIYSLYPPGDQHIPPLERENHLEKCLGKVRGYVSTQKGIRHPYIYDL